ncbi:MAG: GIY-YIG nuclease family protein [Nitrospira sp.]|nr:GIY-YIG nuclease family protein [Nitrospira sp.]
MNKEDILKEIKRTAQENGGMPLGQQRFLRETGIKKSDWYGKIWARWGDAISEAGFSPNSLQTAYDVNVLFERYVQLVRELGRLPTDGDVKLKARSDSTFPSHSTFLLRFGSKSELVRQLVEQYHSLEGYEDIVRLCGQYSPRKEDASNELEPGKIGFVYLIRHGSRREYKIGKTFNPVRREGEIILQLPEKVEPIHYIKTDDPSGIESYWHTRFADKRKEGEWFDLTSSDVQAFKKWKRIL